MIKSIIKSFFVALFIVIIASGIIFSIYYFSPEVNPGEYGVVYKIYGKDKGFTGKILPPGKYYYFISGLIPGIHKVYKIKIKPKYKNINVKIYDGSQINLELVYEIDKKNIDKFLENINKNEIDKILKVFIKSTVDNIFLKFSISDMVKESFNNEVRNKLLKSLNHELNTFGLKITTLNIKNIIFSPEKEQIFQTLQANKLALEKLKIETEKKVKEQQVLNKLKIEKLNFLLKKAEMEKEIAKKKIEKQNIYWEAQKKRLKEEIEILSKPGGEYATKLESIRMIVNSLKNPEKIKQTTEIVNKILNH